MLLVIIGAGAAYDSDPSKPPTKQTDNLLGNRPPLANELFVKRRLFSQVLESFSECYPIIPALRGAGVNVERVLKRFQNESERDPRRHKHLAAIRFYLQTMIYQCTVAWRKEM